MNEIINSFGIDWKIFSAEIVNFLFIIGILYFFVFKKIFLKLEERRDIISKGIEDSKLAEKKITEAKEESVEIISQARIESSEKINAATTTAKEKEESILANAKSKQEEILSKARENGEEQKRNIVLEANAEISKLAVLGAEKILSEK